MVGKGNLAVFESTSISKTVKTMPTKIHVHVHYVKLYKHKSFGGISLDKVFG